MKSLLDWVKKVIIGIAKFFIAIFSLIIETLDPDSKPKGHPLKRVSISINPEGQIVLKSVNGIPFEEFYGKSPFHAERRQGPSTQSHDESKPVVAFSLVQIGGQCYEIESNGLGGLSCFPKQC